MNQSPKAPVSVVGWILWFAILNGLVIMQFLIAGGLPSGVNESAPPAFQQYVPMVPAFLALVVRFLVIPRVATAQGKLPVMLIGLALAEATGILGIFLVDKAYGSTQLTCLVVSVLAILALAPIYLRQDPTDRADAH